MTTTLKQGAKIAKQSGYKRGESAKDWHARNPIEAAKFAQWITANKAALVSELTGAITA